MDGTQPVPVSEIPKIWGRTRSLHADRNCEVHHATIEPRTWCSRHYHDWKWNLFYVVKGELLVQYFHQIHDAVPYQTFHIRKGESFKVPPRQWHRFESTHPADTELIEIYWAEEVLANDITRADIGGRASSHNCRSVEFYCDHCQLQTIHDFDVNDDRRMCTHCGWWIAHPVVSYQPPDGRVTKLDH